METTQCKYHEIHLVEVEKLKHLNRDNADQQQITDQLEVIRLNTYKASKLGVWVSQWYRLSEGA